MSGLNDMHDAPELPTPAPTINASLDDEADNLRISSRSPHPYHRQKSELLEPSGRFEYRAAVSIARNSIDLTASFTKESTPASDSGTEADDEHILKRLPAPRARLHKGLRGQKEPLSGTSTPLLSPALLGEEAILASTLSNRNRTDNNKCSEREKSRRRKELFRRSAEVILLVFLGGLVNANRDAQPFIHIYQSGTTILCSPLNIRGTNMLKSLPLLSCSTFRCLQLTHFESRYGVTNEARVLGQVRYLFP